MELRKMFAQMQAQDYTPDDAFRAELLLGYLAGLNPERKSDGSDTKEEEIAA